MKKARFIIFVAFAFTVCKEVRKENSINSNPDATVITLRKYKVISTILTFRATKMELKLIDGLIDYK